MRGLSCAQDRPASPGPDSTGPRPREAEAQAMFDKYGSDDIDFYYGEVPVKFDSALNGGSATVYF